MTRSTNQKRIAVASSGAALAAAMLSAPSAGAQERSAGARADTASQSTSADAKHPAAAVSLNYAKIRWQYKIKGEYSIAGERDGRTVFEDARGRLFYIDSATGDQKFVTTDFWIKGHRAAQSADGHHYKHFGKVTIVGVDPAGRVIMKNVRGEKFHLDAKTGDMIFVK